MGSLPVHFWWAETNASCDTIDMGIHRESWDSQGKQQHYGGGLGTHTFKAGQPGTAFFNRPFFQEIQVQSAAFSQDLPQDLLNARPFLISQSCRTDGGNNLVGPGSADLLPGWEPVTQGYKCPVTIDIIGILGKDGGDQLIQRWKWMMPVGLTIKSKQKIIHLYGQLMEISHQV